jgi:hypothetical protein
MSEFRGALYANGTASAQIKATAGRVFGVVVNSHTSGTLRFNDGTGGTTSAGAKATRVFTASGVFTGGETITIGTTTYKMVATLTGAPFEVLIGANTAAALDNLKSAINKDAGEGTTYGTGTQANPDVVATTNTDTAQTVEAYRVGTYANTIPTTETCANASWAGATLTGGTDANFLVTNTYTLPAGSQVVNFIEPISFTQGIYLTVGGTINYTVLYN